jgi:hypothetical protein
LTEEEVREAAQLLMVRGSFWLDRRVCFTCHRTETRLVGEPPEP